MKAKFKEKTYESYFQTELGRLTNTSFAPDQTDEGILGFDGTFYLPYEAYPDIFPYVRARRRKLLFGFSAAHIDDFGDELNERLPRFNLNLFVQYKRPHYMLRATAAEWSTWNEPYFRYSTDERQQRLLEKVAEAARGRAAVVYASPAFWTNDDLFTFAREGRIVENSNIADAMWLRAHRRFSYNSAGHLGVGHSEPKPIESEPFKAIIRRGLSQEPMTFTNQMNDLDKQIRSSLESDRSSYDIWLKARDAVIGGDGIESYSGERGSWIDAIVSVIAFGQAFDVRVTALGIRADD